MKRLAVIAALLLACRAPQPHGVTIARTGKASTRMLVTTVGVAIKETGPAEMVKQFGEVYVMTFHDAGVFPFYCTMHQPAMSGQIIVTAL